VAKAEGTMAKGKAVLHAKRAKWWEIVLINIVSLLVATPTQRRISDV
jgi:hypothetical protein